MKKISYIIATIVLVMVVGIGCNSLTNQPNDNEPIKIGWVGPLTGDGKEYGEPVKNSVALAVEEINQAGGINGRQVQAIYEDGKCNGKDAVNAVRKLIDIDKVKIVIGGVCSGETLAMAPITEENKIILISASATSPDVTSAGDYVFRNIPSDAEGGRQLAEMAITKSKRIALISENSAYNQTLEKVFKENLAKFGGELVLDEDFPQESKDFRDILTKAKGVNPEVFVINSQTAATGGLLLKQKSELNVPGSVFATMALASNDAILAAGGMAEGVVVIDAPGLSEGNPKANKFLSDYKQKFGKTNYEIYMGAAYDDIYLLAKAIEKYGLNTDKIRDYLYIMPMYDGVIGNYKFDSNGDVLGLNFMVKVIKDGKAVAM